MRGLASIERQDHGVDIVIDWRLGVGVFEAHRQASSTLVMLNFLSGSADYQVVAHFR
jgi:hypothetical protein